MVTLAFFAVPGAHGLNARLALVYALFPVCQGLPVSNSMINGLRFPPGGFQTDGNVAFNTIQ